MKKLFNLPLAVLTNGALFYDPQVRRECAQADLVMPSLDAGDEELFRYVNRPHAALSFSQIVEGLIAFRSEYSGPIWLEILLLAGVTDLPSEIEKIRGWVEKIAPDRIQLNTAVRPPTEEFAFRVSDERLSDLAHQFGEKAEVIAELAPAEMQKNAAARREDIIALLARRPSSIEEIARGLGVGRAEVSKYVTGMFSEGSVRAVRKDSRLLFTLEVPRKSDYS